jgi:DNA replication ATP-dependent helicase Dna2
MTAKTASFFIAEAAPLLYRELEKVAAHPVWTPRDKVIALAVLLERIFVEATKQEQLVFSTLFARISYAGHLYNIQPDTLRLIHHFRRTAARLRGGHAAAEEQVAMGLRAVAESVLLLSGAAIPAELIGLLGDAPRLRENTGALKYAASIRVTALQDDPDNRCLLAADEEMPGQTVRVRYGLPERNENFNPTISVVQKVFGFPVSLNLLDVEIDDAGDYRPQVIVVEPDYLMDVTAIAECFKDTGLEPYAFLARKFLPYETTDALLLGNIANYFLDRLMNEPELPWQDLFRETFQVYPFAYAPMSDNEVREISKKAQKHYLCLKNMAGGGLAKQDIDPENCVLEPTFFSEQYGLQGRLDLFYRDAEKSAIVELKSSQPFKPNSYGIQRSHFTQTLLYDLLVRSVFGRQTDPAKYILYSGVDVQHLRFAPTVAPEQWEALQLRNQLVAIERLLCNIKPGDVQVPVLGRLRAAHAEGKGFLERDYALFENTYGALNVVERKYFNAFTGFIAREHWIAKIGEDSVENPSGYAALWRSSLADKQQAFSILSHLKIVENCAGQGEPHIIFHKTGQTNPLANFRVGDIAVLYPSIEEGDTVLHHQVIRCTIVELGKERVAVQLRFRQFNLKPFEDAEYWNLEPDMMDMGYASMYRGLFEWAASSGRKRALLLGAQPPAGPDVQQTVDRREDAGLVMTAEQAALFEKIVRSRDYFLLWGPPGTGKTSVMLRALAGWALADTEDNVLILAYTNRAVDEICEALDALGGDIREQYLRIGSKYSTAERFRSQLLSARIAGARTRAELRAVLESRRIFVGTVAAFSQNDNLLKIKKFQRLIVDEASQILEPQIIGLLTRFEHFILIGDHRQLPAITVQRPDMTAVEDEGLQGVGLTDLRDSYFERLYRRCEAQGWEDAVGRLGRQGRMHTEIMDFPNRQFYSGFLKTLSEQAVEEDAGRHYQHENLWYDLPGHKPDFEKIFAEKRVVFLPVPPEEQSPGQKTNRAEAELIAQLVLFFKKLFQLNGRAWNPVQTLGIITPWRAQIAQIRACLGETGQDPDETTIDTVERYQGGARDVIIISTCVNSEWQLQSLVSLSGEGVDRKLNVALTRARQHVVLIGNEAILRLDARYLEFIERYK